MKVQFDETIPCFGVAGNFTGHLEQAGEAKDFANVQTADKNAPKAIFPTYLPKGTDEDFSPDFTSNLKTPGFLHIFPFDFQKIIFPKGEEKLQIEPECGVIFEAKWQEKQLINLKPLVFAASNDCSIRKEGAKKISQKKNWGSSSKGFSNHQLSLDGFEEGCILDDYRIASFLIRGEKVYPYGEDSPVRNYSYIYKKLIAWLLDKFNHQKDQGPAEDIHSYLLESDQPEKIMVSIGATRYTEWGENNFLQNGDKAVVVLYPESLYSKEAILKAVENDDLDSPAISVLSQIVEL